MLHELKLVKLTDKQVALVKECVTLLLNGELPLDKWKLLSRAHKTHRARIAMVKEARDRARISMAVEKDAHARATLRAAREKENHDAATRRDGGFGF